MPADDLRNNDMMAHLIGALEQGQDIGHYGRLVFAMVAHHFMHEDELVEWLARDPSLDEEQARSLAVQVRTRDYNPPRREKILAFQRQQDFPICPSNDPDGCNVYKNLKFPDQVYERIGEYYEQKAEAERQ